MAKTREEMTQIRDLACSMVARQAMQIGETAARQAAVKAVSIATAIVESVDEEMTRRASSPDAAEGIVKGRK